jgi:hypothetical protein
MSKDTYYGFRGTHPGMQRSRHVNCSCVDCIIEDLTVEDDMSQTDITSAIQSGNKHRLSPEQQRGQHNKDSGSPSSAPPEAGEDGEDDEGTKRGKKRHKVNHGKYASWIDGYRAELA